MTEYQTIAGTEPDVDEQHQPRTIVRTNTDGSVYMMTEIEDGAFVQWGTCFKCARRVDSCTCKTGPSAPPYIEKWRTERFTNSFGRRGAQPALPELLKTRERVTDAVLRDLRGKGWTLLPPGEKFTLTWDCDECGKTDIPESEAACPACDSKNPSVEYVDLECPNCGYVAESVDDLAEHRATNAEDDELYDQDDLDFARDTLGPDATDDEVQNLAVQRADRDAGERVVDDGISNALEAVRAHTEERKSDDVGF